MMLSLEASRIKDATCGTVFGISGGEHCSWLQTYHTQQFPSLWYVMNEKHKTLPHLSLSLQVIDAFLVLLVLVIHCAVKPYQKSYINITEALILFCLFGGTIAILDENDIYIGRRVSIFFVLAPFIYGLLFLIYRLLKILFL